MPTTVTTNCNFQFRHCVDYLLTALIYKPVLTVMNDTGPRLVMVPVFMYSQVIEEDVGFSFSPTSLVFEVDQIF